MSDVGRENIPYFLTKEYGDKQRRKQKILLITSIVLCLGILVVNAVWF